LSGSVNSHTGATLHDVARHAGVSIASVSRLVNGFTVKPSLEGRIQKAIVELNYRPNSAGRALRAQKSDQICLSIPDISNPVYQAITKGVQNGFIGSKYRLMLAPRILTVDDVLHQISSLNSNYADGFILLSLVNDPRISEAISSLEIPVVAIGNVEVGPNVGTIKVASGALEIAVTFLNEKYGDKILFLNGPAATIPGRLRKEGFLAAMKKIGQQGSKNILEAKAFSLEAAIEALSNFKDLNEYRSVICGNDLIAAGLLRHISEKGLKAPDDLAIVGIDNTDLATILSPALTTIDYSSEKRGEMAAAFLLKKLKEPETPPMKIEIQPKLVLRASA